MRKPMVAGNWKMNGSRSANQTLIDGINKGLSDIKSAEVLVCPPAVYLADVASAVQGSDIKLGSQDANENNSGAFTGELAADMLTDVGCTHTILGHSERRHIYAESNERIAEKFIAVQAAGLIPILCVGELLEEREAEQTEAVVGRQLDVVIEKAGISAFANAIIAYEPVWAIGTGKTASPEQAQAVHAFIRGRLSASDEAVASNTRLLYGGSVKPENANELFNMTDIDGGLIGGASLNADDFLAICRAAE